MKKTEALEKLRAIVAAQKVTATRDPEIAHSDADDLLLAIIDDPEVTQVFKAIDRWYA